MERDKTVAKTEGETNLESVEGIHTEDKNNSSAMTGDLCHIQLNDLSHLAIEEPTSV